MLRLVPFKEKDYQKRAAGIRQKKRLCHRISEFEFLLNCRMDARIFKYSLFAASISVLWLTSRPRLASLVGISKIRLEALLCGRRLPTINEFMRLCDLVGLNPDLFFRTLEFSGEGSSSKVASADFSDTRSVLRLVTSRASLMQPLKFSMKAPPKPLPPWLTQGSLKGIGHEIRGLQALRLTKEEAQLYSGLLSQSVPRI